MLFEVKTSPAMKARIEDLFVTYADVDDPSIMGGEGLERLCADANIPMDGPQLLILSYLVGATELGRLRKEKWVTGLHLLRYTLSQVVHLTGIY
jgi:DCN1-like protein 4/5